jgi:nucleotide-binding universal stress UspA family protein
LKSILVAVDLSQDSANLFGRAAQLAGQHQAGVTLLHVIEERPQGQEAVQDAIRQHALARLEEFAAGAGFPDAPALRAESGVPHLCITQAARDGAADVLLIGPGRATSVVERMFGSTADRVVRTAMVPILVVRNAATQPYRHAGVAIDFSPLSQLALDAARTLAPQARRTLVHVCEIPLQFEQAMLRVGTSAAEIQRFRQARLADSERRLSEFAGQNGPAEDVSVLEGSPADLLDELAASGRIELLAIGSQGRNIVAQALLGSVARRLLSPSGCDILIVGALGLDT